MTYVVIAISDNGHELISTSVDADSPETAACLVAADYPCGSLAHDSATGTHVPIARYRVMELDVEDDGDTTDDLYICPVCGTVMAYWQVDYHVDCSNGGK